MGLQRVLREIAPPVAPSSELLIKAPIVGFSPFPVSISHSLAFAS